jgi:hypothetical protein
MLSVTRMHIHCYWAHSYTMIDAALQAPRLAAKQLHV